MKAATGELNLTVITLIAIAAVIGFFWFMWPKIQGSLEDQWGKVSGTNRDNWNQGSATTESATPGMIVLDDYFINY